MPASVAIDDEPEIPSVASLRSAYPNPFIETTTISYSPPKAAHVTLKVVDLLLGKTIRELASGTQPAGNYKVSFGAGGLPSGIYFYRLQAGENVDTKKLMVLR